MAAWFDGLSSSLGCHLEQMTHGVVSLTRHISSCTKDVWMMESSTEESNELKRKEVETTKESIRPKVERFMTFYSDIDLENKEKTIAYNDLLLKGDLHNKLFIGKETFEIQKFQNLQQDTQSGNAEAGFVPAMSLTLLGENIDAKASEYKHELNQKNLEMMILRERHEAMYHKLLKLQKATESTNGTTTSLEPATPASIIDRVDINHNASEYEHQLKQQNLEMKILRGKNVAMKLKLLKLQKATECLNAAAGLLPVTSLTSLCENIDPNAAKYEHDLEQKNLEVKILRGQNVAMKHKLLKLQKATECLNAAAGLLPVTSSASLGENINPNSSQHEHELEQKKLEVKILRGRNVALKNNLLKLRKATECLNAAASLLPATSSASLGENIGPNASKYDHDHERKNLEVKILRGRNVAMKHKLLKLQRATQCLNVAAGFLPVTPSASLGENIDQNAAKYEHHLEEKNLEVKILRGRNVAMKHKLLKLQKATKCLNAAAGLLPVTSSASLGENIDPSAAKYEHDLEEKILEVKILRGRNVAMKNKLLKLQKATKCLNAAAGLLPVTSSASLGEDINPNSSQHEHEHELEQKNLEVKILRGRTVAMKLKWLKIWKATQYLTTAAGLLPAMSSASLGKNIHPNASEHEHELEQKNLEVKILRGRNVAMKHKLLKLQRATECLNAAAGLLPVISSTSLGENIDPNSSQHEHELEQKNLEVKILRGRNIAMKHKLLKLWKATRYLNVAAGLLPAKSSASLGENIDPSAAKYEHDLEEKILEVKILRGRNVAMKLKWLKIQKATKCLTVAAGLLPAMSSASLGENINPNASEHEHELKQKNLEVKILRGQNAALKHKFLKLHRATECLNTAAGFLPATSSASLGENINQNAAKYEHSLEEKNLEVKILRGRNVALKHKLLKLQKATEYLNAAAGFLPVTPSASLGENINQNAAKYEHDLEEKILEMKILRDRNVAMKHKLLELQKATKYLNAAAGLLPAMSSPSLGENIDPSAAKYEHDLEEKILEVKILRGRNVAMKNKLLKLQKATECLNAAAGLLPATSSVSLGEDIDPNSSQHEHELEQKNLEVKILRGRNVAMKLKWLKIRKATQYLTAAAGLLPATSSASLGENINPSASEHEHELEQKNLEVKILRGRNVALKHKLLKLRRATECLNAAGGFLPATSSASLDENIDPNAAKYEHDLEQKNLEVKILRGRNVAMKHKLLKLHRATECLNAGAGFLPATSSASLGENINQNPAKYEHDLEEKNLEMKILRGRNVVMKHKLLKLQKATQCVNGEVSLVPAMPSSTSLGDNIDPNASQYEHQLEVKSIDHLTSSTSQHLYNGITRYLVQSISNIF